MRSERLLPKGKAYVSQEGQDTIDRLTIVTASSSRACVGLTGWRNQSRLSLFSRSPVSLSGKAEQVFSVWVPVRPLPCIYRCTLTLSGLFHLLGFGFPTSEFGFRFSFCLFRISIPATIPYYCSFHSIHYIRYVVAVDARSSPWCRCMYTIIVLLWMSALLIVCPPPT